MDEHKDFVSQIFKNVNRAFRFHSIVSILMFGFAAVMIIGTMFVGFSSYRSSRREFDIILLMHIMKCIVGQHMLFILNLC